MVTFTSPHKQANMYIYISHTWNNHMWPLYNIYIYTCLVLYSMCRYLMIVFGHLMTMGWGSCSCAMLRLACSSNAAMSSMETCEKPQEATVLLKTHVVAMYSLKPMSIVIAHLKWMVKSQNPCWLISLGVSWELSQFITENPITFG